MSPEQVNMFVTALQGVQSSIEVVAELLAVLCIVHFINNFIK